MYLNAEMELDDRLMLRKTDLNKCRNSIELQIEKVSTNFDDLSEEGESLQNDRKVISWHFKVFTGKASISEEPYR